MTDLPVMLTHHALSPAIFDDHSFNLEALARQLHHEALIDRGYRPEGEITVAIHHPELGFRPAVTGRSATAVAWTADGVGR